MDIVYWLCRSSKYRYLNNTFRSFLTTTTTSCFELSAFVDNYTS